MTNETVHIENCELCVIGMGVSGLNALNSSAQYLSKKDKVIVVDKRSASGAIGGMWNNTYPFVRLHQPHPLFTVGSKKWKLNKQPDYLAKREDILVHFQECYADLKSNLSITEKFGYEYLGYEEVEEGDGYEVHLRFQSTDNSAPPLLVKAKRCIKSFGFNIARSHPMTFSTDKVHAAVPQTDVLLNGEMARGDKPIYIVGGGKTSMDVAGLLLKQNPNRKINFIVGKGTYFFSRDLFFPTGIKRYWQGQTLNQTLMELTLKYDPEDLGSVIKSIRSEYGTGPFKEATHCLYGLLSSEESRLIENGVKDIVYDYLTDVMEEDGQISIKYKSGKTQAIEPGSWFINCTGYLYAKREEPEPVLSPHGTVLSINMTSATLAFSSFGGYFLPHLWFRDKFKDFPIYELDHADLAKKNKEAFLFGAAAQLIYNVISIFDALPLKVVLDCGLNFDKWYPLHRQGLVMSRLLLNKKKYLKKTTEVLEHVCSTYDVKGGVIR